MKPLYILLKWLLGLLVIPLILIAVFFIWFICLVITLILGLQQIILEKINEKN